jgi:hypothetical protein
MASGRANRAIRPNTWLLRPNLLRAKKALANPEPSMAGRDRPSDQERPCLHIAGSAVVAPSRTCHGTRGSIRLCTENLTTLVPFLGVYVLSLPKSVNEYWALETIAAPQRRRVVLRPRAVRASVVVRAEVSPYPAKRLSAGRSHEAARISDSFRKSRNLAAELAAQSSVGMLGVGNANVQPPISSSR